MKRIYQNLNLDLPDLKDELTPVQNREINQMFDSNFISDLIQSRPNRPDVQTPEGLVVQLGGPCLKWGLIDSSMNDEIAN